MIEHNLNYFIFFFKKLKVAAYLKQLMPINKVQEHFRQPLSRATFFDDCLCFLSNFHY